MKDIKTAKQFYKLFTDKELTVLSIEQKMQLYAEYYHKAKVEKTLPKNDRHILENFINNKRFEWNKQIFSVRIIKPLLVKLLNDL